MTEQQKPQELGAEQLDAEQKQEIVEDRYWDKRVSHWIAVFTVIAWTSYLIFADVKPDKISAIAGLFYSVVSFMAILSLTHLAKGLGAKLAEKWSK